MADIRNSIIIGSGPAGYTAALYLARARLSPLVLAGAPGGGQLMLTTEVENFPGFPQGILGPELMGKIREQAQRFRAEIIDQNVSWVDFSRQPFLLGTGEKPREMDNYRETLSDGQKKNTDVYLARSVIVSTGAQAQMLGIGEERLLGRGVSTCAVCDAAFFKDKVTFVVGGGDSAMEEALVLLKFARSVTIIHRRDAFRASKIMQQRVLEENKDKVSVLWNSEVREVHGLEKLEAIVVEEVGGGERKSLAADGLFLAIGYLPATELVRGQVELDEKGYLLTGLNGLSEEVLRQSGSSHLARTAQDDKPALKSLAGLSRTQTLWLEGYPTMTSVSGVFGAGDAVDFRYRQAVTAAGFGCMAALDVENYLVKS